METKSNSELSHHKYEYKLLLGTTMMHPGLYTNMKTALMWSIATLYSSYICWVVVALWDPESSWFTPAAGLRWASTSHIIFFFLPLLVHCHSHPRLVCPRRWQVLGILRDDEKTVTHSDAASGWWVDREQLFTLLGDEEEKVAKWGVAETAKCLFKEDKFWAIYKNPFDTVYNL